LALALQGTAKAAESASGDEEQVLEEVSVTGSRISAPAGYEAPTPLTVLSTDELLGESANASLKDSLQSLPVFAGGGYSTSQGSGVPSFNQAGVSSVEMRGLGITRTLVLLDGQRSVGSLANGLVDTDNFPQQLIKRVEVVTGGASAVYGSDAVAGVVNFILDRDFTGVKGEISGGQTQYGDAENWKLSLAGGFPFAGGRGHVLLSGETTDNNGVKGGTRDWEWTTKQYIINPAYAAGNGQPEYVTRDNASIAVATHGGIISFGPLRGVAFGEGGTPYQFNYGEGVLRDTLMAGGDYRSTLTADGWTYLPSQERKNVFARVAFDVTDHFNVFGQFSRGVNSTDGVAFPHYMIGSQTSSPAPSSGGFASGVLVLSGNPFIPASVQAQMTAKNVAYFRVGTMAYDLPFVTTTTSRGINRFVLGGEGDFDLVGNNWKWNAYAQFGRTKGNTQTNNARNKARFDEALDAVRGPNGTIVCRSTLTNPNNGCVPFNAMGTGVNDQAALDYILGSAYDYQTVSQDVYAASVTGVAFDNWAGPVSVALSAEYRKEAATVVPDPIATVSGWHSGNHQPLDASTHVSEAAIEVLFPLLMDKPFARQWDLSAAYRYTDYQISGGVNTWKFGTTWTPVSGLRFRGTVSRDIRAPNISDLFQAQNFGLGAITNPWSNAANTIDRVQEGSPNLTPEIADTFTVGLVFQPEFAPGLGISVDYWSTKVKDAIALISANNVPSLCFQGWTDLCSWISWDPNAGAPFSSTGIITKARQGNFNMASQKARGIDVEASYRFPLAALADSLPGSISMRLIGSRNLENFTEDGLASTINVDSIGAGVPKINLTAGIDYTLGQFTGGIATRYFSDTVTSNTAIECQTGCPTSTATNRTYDNIQRDGGLYFDLSLAYKLDSLFGRDSDSRLFFNVRNITNKDPELTPATGGDLQSYIYGRSGSGNSRWDLLGRTYRIGLDFKF
jgi:outer membrane receptor protein involved in Fe transport